MFTKIFSFICLYFYHYLNKKFNSLNDKINDKIKVFFLFVHANSTEFKLYMEIIL